MFHSDGIATGSIVSNQSIAAAPQATTSIHRRAILATSGSAKPISSLVHRLPR